MDLLFYASSAGSLQRTEDIDIAKLEISDAYEKVRTVTGHIFVLKIPQIRLSANSAGQVMLNSTVMEPPKRSTSEEEMAAWPLKSLWEPCSSKCWLPSC